MKALSNRCDTQDVHTNTEHISANIICHVSLCAENLSGQKQEMLFKSGFRDEVQSLRVDLLIDL